MTSVRILVVDDESSFVEILRRGLRKMGYDVVGATDSEGALAHLRDGNERIDLVVTDYRMPGMSGIELLKALRKQKVFVPVILMTAYGNKRLLKDFFNCGGNGYIEKPFLMDDLAKTISLELQKGITTRKNESMNVKQRI